MQTDYLIVGQGIAGTVLGFTLLKNGHSIAVINNEDPSCASRVAAGLYNPVTGKRKTKTWKAEELFPFTESFYKEFEKKYSCTVVHSMSIYKPFSSIEEQNTWLSSYEGEAFVDTDIPKEKYDRFIQNNYGGFETKHSGYIDVPLFLDVFRKNISVNQNSFHEEIFDLKKLTFNETGIQYGNISAKKIIFCEGVKVLSNPLFHWLPLVPSKGEVLNVRIENFTEDAVLNKQVFVIPLGQHQYRVGSTYQWVFETENPTEKGKAELAEKLTAMIKMPFEISGHKAGVRPSVKDRKPIIGLHPENKSVAIFNGLGTKGVSLAPYFAEGFVQYLEGKKQLLPEVNIERFYSLYSRSEY